MDTEQEKESQFFQSKLNDREQEKKKEREMIVILLTNITSISDIEIDMQIVSILSCKIKLNYCLIIPKHDQNKFQRRNKTKTFRIKYRLLTNL